MKFHHLPILFMATTSLPAVAQSTAPAPTSRAEAAQDTADEEPEIVVTGQRERGAVPGDIKPELQLRAADVRSYGVSSIAELLGALSPQVQGGKSGPPVVLLNGQRISSFSEIRDLPTEAISRVDILPEEVALKYGYAAGQKVVNIVLRQRFRAITGELSDTYPIDGDANSPQAEANLLRIRKDGRFTLNLKYNQRDALLESQRDIVDPAPPSPFDPALRVTSLSSFRTLIPATKTASANAVFNKTVFGNVAATINGTIDVANSSGLRGRRVVELKELPSGVRRPKAGRGMIDRHPGSSGADQIVPAIVQCLFSRLW